MDSQINKFHSLTIFFVVLSDSMGFWDASISSSDHMRRHIQYKHRQTTLCVRGLIYVCMKRRESIRVVNIALKIAHLNHISV